MSTVSTQCLSSPFCHRFLFRIGILACEYIIACLYTANMIGLHSPNSGVMLAHRLGRWFSITKLLGERLVFAGIYVPDGGPTLTQH